MFGSLMSKDKREQIITAHAKYRSFMQGLSNMRITAEDKNVKVIMDGKYNVVSITFNNPQDISSDSLSKQTQKLLAMAHDKTEKIVKKYTKTSGFNGYVKDLTNIR